MQHLVMPTKSKSRKPCLLDLSDCEQIRSNQTLLMHGDVIQVLSIVTTAVAFVAMAGSIFGMNLYFNVQTTPPVSFWHQAVTEHCSISNACNLLSVCIPSASQATSTCSMRQKEDHATPLCGMQVAFWSCAMSIVIVGLTIMLVVMAYARHKRLIFIPGSHHMAHS